MKEKWIHAVKGLAIFAGIYFLTVVLSVLFHVVVRKKKLMDMRRLRH